MNVSKNTRNSLIILMLSSLLSGCAGAIVAGGSAASAAHDRRTLGSFVEDQNIELKAYDALEKDKELSDKSHISVTSYNGIVLLSGQTPEPALRARATEIVSKIEKVRKVHNELTISAPVSAGTRGHDTWVTTKVKTNLFKVKGHENFDPTRVKVITEDGTVYLMGLVRRAEADDAVNVIRKIEGVQRVVKIFEYID